jgi:hypothetical protein
MQGEPGVWNSNPVFTELSRLGSGTGKYSYTPGSRSNGP